MPLHAAADRLALAPPPEPGQARAFGLAVLAHLLLAVALTWGTTWNSDDREVTAEAELWSPTVQRAAPALIETPTPPAPPPQPPAPPAPKLATPPAPPLPQAKDADIALDRAKKEREKQEAEKALKERQRQAKAEAEKKAAEKKATEKKAADKKAAERKLAEQKAEKEQRAREEAEAKRVAQLREENLQRMQGLAGATGGPSATGNALKSAGPSDSYAGRIRARVKPNIVFTEDIAGNPVAEVEVKMSPEGTIISRRITKSSGVKSWDDAVLRALDRTEVLPRDTDGRVHSPLIMEFRPRG